MKAKDFEVNYQSGLITCCGDHVFEYEDDVEEGSIITCMHCGLDMILKDCGGRLMWCFYDE